MKKLLVVALGAFLTTSLSGGGAPYKAGDIIPDFSLKNTEGKMISLSGIKEAKGFIVVFMCNTCPVVKQYEERIISLDKEFRGKGFPVIAINSNDKNVSPGDSFEEMQRTAGNENYSFQYLYDESQEVAKRFGATNTPHVYVISRTGNNLKVEYVGAIDNNADEAGKADKKYVADAVTRLLSGKHVVVAGTKAIGCGIKWKKV